MTQAITVLLADDQQMVRSGFAMILSVQSDIQVIGQAANGQEAVQLTRELQPDVVLMDVQMPMMDGIAATRHIADQTHVVILTTFDRDDYLFDALAAGACGFLLKNAGPEKLVEAIRVAAQGQALLAPEVTLRVIAHMAEVRQGIGQYQLNADLTERENEVLVAMAQGLSNAEIAAKLVVGESTVKTHVSNVLAKLGVRDRVQAVAWAYQHRLL